MEFRKMVMITLYARQQKRHRCIEQSFGLCGRGQGWDGLGEWHWNMGIIICETDCQSRFDAWDRVFGAGALGWFRGMGWGGRWEGGSWWGTHVHPWLIHVNVWKNQYHWEDLEGSGGEGGGRGDRDENTCKPMAVSFQCMTKFTTIKKKRKKQYKIVT